MTSKTKPLSKASETPAAASLRQQRRDEEQRILRSLSTALALLDGHGKTRQQAPYWQRRYIAGDFMLLGYYATRPPRIDADNPARKPPYLLILTFKGRLIVLVEMGATANMRIEVYVPGEWEAKFWSLIPSDAELVAELRRPRNPILRMALALFAPAPRRRKERT